MSLRYEQHYIQNPHVFGSMNKYSASPNFHQRRSKNPPPSLNNNFMLSRNNPPQSYQSLNLSNSINQLPNDSKVSHARNFKQRLFQADQLQQAKKEFQKMSYRQELEQQMKADKERKLREKEKIQREELERERKFYAELGNIKAQEPKPKQEPSYLILRSRKGGREKQKTERGLQSMDQSRSVKNKGSEQKVSELQMPKIMKRGGYHNQSSLDSMNPQISKQQVSLNQQRIENPQTSRISPFGASRKAQVQQREMQIIKQRNYEERISSIIKLQEKTIKKLEFFKQQIIRSNNQFNADKEVQQIRNILRSKPIKLEVWGVKNDQIFNNNSDFYAFPKADPRIMTRSRNRHNRSINEGIDLNNHQEAQMPRTLTPQNQENQQNSHQNEAALTSRKRKREIKLFKSSNDKNYAQTIDQEHQNPQEMSIPVVLRQRDNGNQEEDN